MTKDQAIKYLVSSIGRGFNYIAGDCECSAAEMYCSCCGERECSEQCYTGTHKKSCKLNKALEALK